MSKPETIEHDSAIVCPYCGEEHRNTFDFQEGIREGEDSKVTCYKCDGEFMFKYELTVTFISHPIAKRANKKEPKQ